MDIFELLGMVRRWWFVAIPSSAAVLLASITLTAGIQPEFTARGSVLFNGPLVRENVNNPGELQSVNPLLEQPSALITAAAITTLSIDSPIVSTILSDEGLSTDFDVGAENVTPIMTVVVRAGSRAEAVDTAIRLTELIERDVQLRQEAAEVADRDLVTTSVIALSTQGGADYGARNRLRIVLVAFGMAVAAGLLFLLEGFQRWRAARNDGDSDESAVIQEPASRGPETYHPERVRGVEDEAIGDPAPARIGNSRS